jgi:hypothetical protein
VVWFVNVCFDIAIACATKDRRLYSFHFIFISFHFHFHVFLRFVFSECLGAQKRDAEYGVDVRRFTAMLNKDMRDAYTEYEKLNERNVYAVCLLIDYRKYYKFMSIIIIFWKRMCLCLLVGYRSIVS